MTEIEKYMIWKGYKGDKSELIATFYDLENAKDFVDYQATYNSDAYTITKDGVFVYPEE